jgi:hypothetical protein
MTKHKVDHNIEKWTALCKDSATADKILKDFVTKLSEKKLIVSAKKELVSEKKLANNLIPYKFTVITAEKNEK